MLTDQELKEMLDRCDVATPGPWEIAPPTMAGNKRPVIESYGLGSVAAVSLNGAPKTQGRLSTEDPHHANQCVVMEANARFLANARTDLPRIIAAYREQAAELEHYKRALEWLADEIAEPSSDSNGCDRRCAYAFMPSRTICPLWKNDGDVKDAYDDFESWYEDVFPENDGEPISCATHPSNCWLHVALEATKESSCQKI